MPNTTQQQLAEAKAQLARIEKEQIARSGKGALIPETYKRTYEQMESPELLKRIRSASGELSAAPDVLRERHQNIFNPFEKQRLVSTGTAQIQQKLMALRDLRTRRSGSAESAGKRALALYQSGTQRLQTESGIATGALSRLQADDDRSFTRGRQTEQDRISRQKFAFDRFKEGIDTSYEDIGVTGQKVFGVYATDPKWAGSVESIYNGLDSVWNRTSTPDIDKYIKDKAPGSSITSSMIHNAALEYGVEPNLLTAIMQQESTFGTKGRAVRTMNPGNVGNTDDGTEAHMKSWQDGVNALAENISKRNKAGLTTIQEIGTGIIGGQSGIIDRGTDTETDFTDQETRKLEQEFGPNWQHETSRQQQLDYLYGEELIDKMLTPSVLSKLAIAGIDEDIARGLLSLIQARWEPSEIEEALKNGGHPTAYYQRMVDVLGASPLLGITGGYIDRTPKGD